MTKLLEWLAGVVLFVGVWLALVTGKIHSCYLDKWMFLIWPSPVILVILFGLYAVTIVLYRTFTFNDCQSAADELQKQIVEAREDLKQKGYIFN